MTVGIRYTKRDTESQRVIERLSNDQRKAFSILEDNLNLLTDMRHVYTVSNTLQKREFVKRVFDSNLYYENGIYRTPTILGLLSHNHLKMKESRGWYTKRKRGFLMKTLSAGCQGPQSNPSFNY